MNASPMSAAPTSEAVPPAGADVVLALYRLVKVAQVHALDNQATLRQLDAAATAVGQQAKTVRGGISILFARGAVYFGGAPLRAPRSVYEAALELGEIVAQVGAAEISIAGEVGTDDLRALVVLLLTRERRVVDGELRPSRNIRLRGASDAALLRDVEIEHLPEDQRIVRAYASAVVLLRRCLEGIAGPTARLPRGLKRVAQQIVDLSAGSTPAYLGVTNARNANHDVAGRAVNAAILAVAMGRQVSADRVVLSRIALAAMLCDVGHARVLARANDASSAWKRTLTEDEERAVPAETLGSVVELGRVHAASIEHAVIAHEALWLARKPLGVVYRGVRGATLHARIVAIARAYCALLATPPGEIAPSPAEAIARLDAEIAAQSAAPRRGSNVTFGDSVDRTVLRLLVAATGAVPAGTLFELSTNEIAVVVVAATQGEGASPMLLRVVLDDAGGVVDRGQEFTLESSPSRRLVRMIGSDPAFAATRSAPSFSKTPPAKLSDSSVREASAPDLSVVDLSAIDLSAIELSAVDLSMVTIRTLSVVERLDVGGPGAESASDVDEPNLTIASSPPGRIDGDDNDGGGSPIDVAPLTPARPADAAGRLAETPFAHLLVHALTRSLSGTLVLRPGGRDTFAFVFRGGEVVHVWSADGTPSLAALLAARDIRIDGDVVAARSKSRDVPFAREIFDSRIASQDLLAQVLAEQLRARVAAAAASDDETTFGFHRDDDVTPRHGDRARKGVTPLRVDPLAAIAIAVAASAKSPQIDAVLDRLGDRPLALHARAQLDRFGFPASIVDAIVRAASERASLPALLRTTERARDRARDDLRAALYTVAITRHLDIGGPDPWPVGVVRVPSEPPPSQTPAPISEPSSSSRRSLPPRPSMAPASRRSMLPSINPQIVAWRRRLQDQLTRIDTPNHYEALGIARTATTAQVQTAHASAMQQFSPTALPPELDDLRHQALKIRARLTEALRVLTDPAARADHDALLEADDLPDFAAPIAEEEGVAPGSLGRARAAARLASDRPLEPAPPSVNAGIAARRAEIESLVSRLDTLDGHTLLGVASDANVATIRAAYVVAAKRLHPDTLGDALADLRPSATRIFARIEEAHRLLTDPGARSRAKALAEREANRDEEERAITRALEASTCFHRAEAMVLRGELEGAEQMAACAMEGDPTHPEYSALHAYARACRGGPNGMIDALATLDKSVDAMPMSDRVLVWRAKILLRLGRDRDAARDLRSALELNPKNVEVARELRLRAMRSSPPGPRSDPPPSGRRSRS